MHQFKFQMKLKHINNHSPNSYFSCFSV